MVTVACVFIVVYRKQVVGGVLPGYPLAPISFIFFTLMFSGLAATRNPLEMLAALLTILSAVILYALFGSKHQKLRNNSA